MGSDHPSDSPHPNRDDEPIDDLHEHVGADSNPEDDEQDIDESEDMSELASTHPEDDDPDEDEYVDLSEYVRPEDRLDEQEQEQEPGADR